MSKIIILKGLPACGKTTWSKDYQKAHPDAVRTNKDELRAMMHNSVWSKGKEWSVVHVRDFIINQVMTEGHDCLVDDTNLHLKHENHIREMVLDFNNKNGKKIEFEIKDFSGVPLEECIRRDAARLNPVGEKVIRRFYEQFLKPETKLLAQDMKLPRAIWVDLDGTLAHLNGRDPYDASTCENDGLNQEVADILSLHKARGDSIIIVSGRQSTWRTQTEAWLMKNLINYDKLFMRPGLDARKDSIIKKEIYDAEIKDKYRILFCLDDRNQVVEMLRGIGLQVFQVADGNF